VQKEREREREREIERGLTRQKPTLLEGDKMK